MSDTRRVARSSRAGLTPRAARVFYNAADAWIPPGAGGAPGGGDADLVARLVLAPGERRRLERALLWLEWSPRLLLHSRRGLSWLARADRRAWLEHLEHRSPPPLRRAAARVHRAVEQAWKGEVRS